MKEIKSFKLADGGGDTRTSPYIDSGRHRIRVPANIPKGWERSA